MSCRLLAESDVRSSAQRHAVRVLLYGFDLGHCSYTSVFYYGVMTTQHQADLLRNAKLLVAAVQLRKTHGLLYAMRFLEEHDFSVEVVWELLNLIPYAASSDSTDC